MIRNLIPPDATISELEKKAADCEQQAAQADQPRAAELQKEAKRYRGWVAALRTGRWTSLRRDIRRTE